LIFSIVNIFDISKYAVDKEKAIKLRDLKFDKQQEFDTYRQKFIDIYNTNIIELLSSFTQNYKSINDLRKGLLIEVRSILDFYSNLHNDESPNIIQEMQVVTDAYTKLINLKKNDLGDQGSNIKLNLNDASEFLKDYAILRNHSDFMNEITLCMPDNIKYFKNNSEFYFSSGQDSMIRMFTYIYLAVKNLSKMSRSDEVSLIVLLDEPDNALHPEMQKQFIKYVNDFLNSSIYGQCRFHVIMTTHSPLKLPK
jgi:predicted ATP-dependent endonuclease of OLD family